MYYPLPIGKADYMKIKGVCKQYNAQINNPRKDGGGIVPGYEEQYMVWTPTGGEGGSSWVNRKSGDNLWIVERNVSGTANQKHVERITAEKNLRRITNWRENANSSFQFIGVYEIEPTLTQMSGVRIYRQISDTLPALEIKPGE